MTWVSSRDMVPDPWEVGAPSDGKWPASISSRRQAVRCRHSGTSPARHSRRRAHHRGMARNQPHHSTR